MNGEGTMEIIVRPSDFVHPPFIKCPKCGAEAFGVLNILGDRYSRRCRLCLFPKPPETHPPTRLPKLDKKVIYLDQFVISNMMFSLDRSSKSHGRSTHHDFYRDLFKKLDTLGKKQLIVCPESEFHRYESLPKEYYDSLRRMYKLLSYGVRSSAVNEICRSQILEAFGWWVDGKAVRASQYDKDCFLRGDRTAWTGHFSVTIKQRISSSFLEGLRKQREAVDTDIKEVFERWRTERGKEFVEWVAEETLGKARCCIHDVVLMEQLRDKLRDRDSGEDEWFDKISEFFRSEHFQEVISSKLAAMMWATVAHRAANGGQKKPPTRGFSNDVGFISSFLPYCDAMFVDKECHGILDDKFMRDTVEQFCDTKVFSLRNKASFVEYLDRVETEASQQHMGLLDEVYGDAYLKPYVGLYDGRKSE